MGLHARHLEVQARHLGLQTGNLGLQAAQGWGGPPLDCEALEMRGLVVRVRVRVRIRVQRMDIPLGCDALEMLVLELLCGSSGSCSESRSQCRPIFWLTSWSTCSK